MTLQEKLKVIDFVNSGKTHAQASEKFNVLRSSITQMVKDKGSIHQALKENKRLRKRKVLSYEVKVSIINDMVHSWHVQVEVDAPTLNVTCDVLQTKALAFRDQILEDHSATIDPELVESLKKFKASNGWLQSYLKQKGTTSKRRCGEHSSANLISIEQRLTEIRKLLEDVPIQNIWNLDETALQHRSTSSHSYVTINNDGCGVKHSKEHIIVTLIVSASGEKLIPQVIGKSKQPCVLRVIDIDKKYQSNMISNQMLGKMVHQCCNYFIGLLVLPKVANQNVTCC